jgi:coenzyme F420-reducing hydrogenase delta subunit/NAD-dependent dihydropyrimidine dehydrogenase PreA subunit
VTEQQNLPVEISTRVLVIGSGFAGVTAAAEIVEAGYRVALLSSGKSLKADEWRSGPETHFALHNPVGFQDALARVGSDNRIAVLADGELIGVDGMPGDFRVQIDRGGQTVDGTFGAIVVATDLETKPMHATYGLALSGSVLSQSQLELSLAADPQQFSGKNVAFLVGFGQEGHPLAMERVFRSVLALQSQDGCQSYVYVGDLKVASDGLERLYRESRDRDAIYFKLRTMPGIDPDTGEISFFDPVIHRNVSLMPDVIVVEETLAAGEINRRLAEQLHIELGPADFLQTDNVHHFPVRSTREGIYVIGSSRDVQSLPAAVDDVGNVVLALKDFLADGNIIPPAMTAVVDRNKCCICLTCYRSCPHGAIYYDDKAIISPLACQACGICASECPQEAIQVGQFEDDRIQEAIKAALTEQQGAPRLVAFCCQNSAYEAGLMARTFQLPLPAGLEMIKVPCAGKIDIDYLMSAFLEGADGVLVMTCHPGNCKSERGNTHAQSRVELVQQMLEDAGIDRSRLQFVTLASNMGAEFAARAVELEKRIENPEAAAGGD